MTAPVKMLIHKQFMDRIFEGSRKELNKLLDSLLDSQFILTGDKSCMYKGRVLAHPDYRPNKRVCLLHRSLYDKGDNYIKELNALGDQESLVSGFLSVLLTKSGTYEELWAFCPECIRSVVKKPEGTLSVPQEEIQAFWEANTGTIEVIKTNLVLNLLL